MEKGKGKLYFLRKINPQSDSREWFWLGVSLINLLYSSIIILSIFKPEPDFLSLETENKNSKLNLHRFDENIVLVFKTIINFMKYGRNRIFWMSYLLNQS
jgi:hypothetical protein